MSMKIAIVAIVGFVFFFGQSCEAGVLRLLPKYLFDKINTNIFIVPFCSLVLRHSKKLKTIAAPAPDGTCGGEICGAYQECSSCNQNHCNTYTCDNPTPPCNLSCFVPDPKCVCKPHYYRPTPNGPCKQLKC